MQPQDVTARTLRLGRERALELNTATDLTQDDRNALEHERVALFLWAEGLARRTRIQLTVTRDSGVADFHAFIDRALAVDIANAKRVKRQAFGGRLTSAQRRDLRRRFPSYSRLSATDLLDAGARGYRGVAAVRFAVTAATVARVGNPPASTTGRSSRPRERASRSARRSPTSSDDGPLPPPPRRHLAQLIDQAKRRQIADKRVCSCCSRWLPPDEFGSHRWCRSCKAADAASRRAAREAVPA